MQALDRLPFHIGAEMRVSHRLGYPPVAHELLDGLQGLAADREPAAEGVAQGPKNDLVSIVVDAGIQVQLVQNAPEGICDLVFFNAAADCLHFTASKLRGNTCCFGFHLGNHARA